jgi:DNA-binding MarR family transcriptional regulator
VCRSFAEREDGSAIDVFAIDASQRSSSSLAQGQARSGAGHPNVPPPAVERARVRVVQNGGSPEISLLTPDDAAIWTTLPHRARGGAATARGVLQRRAMHPLAFFQKRAHLCAVARGREMFAHVEDMTPARFDVLYAIYMGARSPVRVREWLGLARQTVWRMIERLVELGLVEKEKGYPRGTVTIRFTLEGAQRFRHAMDAAFNDRWPLPKDAPTEGEVPRYWKRPELADDPAIRATARNRPHVRPRDGGLPLAHAKSAADTESAAAPTSGPPPGASLEERQQYFDSLYDGTYARPKPKPKPNAKPALPKKRGREVAKLLSAFAWSCCPRGPHPKRDRHLVFLDYLVSLAEGIARALGNEAWPLYPLRITEEMND